MYVIIGSQKYTCIWQRETCILKEVASLTNRIKNVFIAFLGLFSNNLLALKKDR
jgi:hypothetical protein